MERTNVVQKPEESTEDYIRRGLAAQFATTNGVPPPEAVKIVKAQILAKPGDPRGVAMRRVLEEMGIW